MKNNCPICNDPLSYYQTANLTIKYAGREFCSELCLDIWLDRKQMAIGYVSNDEPIKLNTDSIMVFPEGFSLEEKIKEFLKDLGGK